MSKDETGFHESAERLSEDTQNLHRALISLVEELEAVDWYHQRAELASDPELAAVLRHHRNEEIEHAMMLLEWIRRHDTSFAQHAAHYLFSEQPIMESEADKPGEVDSASSSLGIGGLMSIRHGAQR